MDIGAVITGIEQIGAFDRPGASLDDTKASLVTARRVRGWVDAQILLMTQRLCEVSSFPEGDLATASRTAQKSATAALKRADTVAKMPDFGRSLADGAISSEHVDSATRALGRLKAEHRPAFIRQSGRLALLAGNTTPEEFENKLRREEETLSSGDGRDRLTRQRSAARLRTWEDKNTGMWCIHGQFDPETGLTLAAKIEAMLATKFAEQTPDGAPDDPGQKQDWLRAQAFIALLTGDPAASATKGGKPEAVVVIDTRTGTVRWPFDVRLPVDALQRYLDRAEIYVVDIHGRRLLFAPGNLNLGRTTRLANRAQRRALGALYATCAIPGCNVRYEHTKPHHVQWWRYGGPTDLANLLPLCSRHHHMAHEGGWKLALTLERTLTITLPDGRIMTTGPPGTIAA
jgi:Domain of unknown function (DUF222)